MKFILFHKRGYGRHILDEAVRFLLANGAQVTEDVKEADFALSIGGDGTLMQNHYMLRCPVLGINPGKSIGHYMRAGRDDYRNRIAAMINGKPGRDYYIYGLMRLEAAVNGEKMHALALNDVLVSPIYVRRMLETKLSLSSGKTTERNSGVIVYTPTGSHAFAHSAGARKLSYGSRLLGVAALAPYSGALKKSEILVEKETVKIEMLSSAGEVCIDGSDVNIRKIKKGDVVEIRRSKHDLKLVGFSSEFA